MANENSAVDRNPRLLFWGRLFLEIKIFTSVIVLFYLHRGITLGDVIRLSIVWSLTSLVAEIPSGYLADRIGRKATLMLGAIFILASGLLMISADSFFDFSSVMVMSSLGRACLSGTEEAMLYDSLRVIGQESDMIRQSGRLISARFAAAMFVPLIGSFIAQDLLAWQFLILIGADNLFVLIAIVIFSLLKEPADRTRPIEVKPAIFYQSLRIIRENPWLMKAMLNKVLVFTAAFLIFRAYQPLLSGYGFSVVLIGLYYSVSRGLMFLSNRFVSSIDSLIGTARAIGWSAAVAALFIAIALYFDAPWVMFILLLLADVLLSLREPLFSQAINNRIESACRATTLSSLNCLKGVIDIPLLLVAGWLAELNVSYVLIMTVILCVCALIVCPMRQFDFDIRRTEGSND